MTELVGISRDWYNPKEPKYKECPKCNGKGEVWLSKCCYAEIHVEGGYCMECGKPCGLADCKKCSGTGQIEDESDEFDRADDIRDDKEFKEHFKEN